MDNNQNEYLSHSQEFHTTCEIYHKLVEKEMLPSVYCSLYSFLHFGIRQELNTNLFFQKQILKYFLNSLSLGKENTKKISDVAFLYENSNINYLGIQSQISKICLEKNIRTEILLYNYKQDKFDYSFDKISEIKTPYPLIPYKERKKIYEQCKLLTFELKQKFPFCQDITNEDLNKNLFRFAISIESLSNVFISMFESSQVKVLFLLNSMSSINVSAQLAARKLKLRTVLVPHGFPQKSQYPINSDNIVSFCPHHDRYLQTLSSSHTSVHGLGWLEPNCLIESNPFLKELQERDRSSSNKYKILVLSQLTGYKVHKCPSLVSLFPRLLEELALISEIDSVSIRLHPNELNDFILATLLSNIHGLKINVSKNQSIGQDLIACDVVIAFSSTGLLYAPYLGLNGIEIRNEEIDSVWGETVLPNESVLHINKEKDWSKLRELILRKNFPRGNEVFYNWKDETQSFATFICETLHLA
jgi:hypothetical protein